MVRPSPCSTRRYVVHLVEACVGKVGAAGGTVRGASRLGVSRDMLCLQSLAACWCHHTVGRLWGGHDGGTRGWGQPGPLPFVTRGHATRGAPRRWSAMIVDRGGMPWSVDAKLLTLPVVTAQFVAPVRSYWEAHSRDYARPRLLPGFLFCVFPSLLSHPVGQDHQEGGPPPRVHRLQIQVAQDAGPVQALRAG